MNISYLPQARRYLIDIGEWIALDNEERATTLVAELYAACEELVDRPKLYPLVPGTRTLRRRLVQPYLIFYRARRDEVVIVSIRHGARDNTRLR